MATTNGHSLTELERQAETNRAELARTVDALHSRVSPSAIKSDVRNYVRDTGQGLVDSVETRIRENPLQAAAVAVGIAYPLWRMVSRMPAPVLLIGAGLALSRRSSSTDSYSYRSYRRPDFDPSGAESGSTMSSIKESASDLGSQVTDTVKDTIQNVKEKLSETVSGASDMAGDTYRRSSESASNMMHQASDTYVRSRDNLVDMVDRHPLAAGAIALAAGGLLASLLPSTRQERRLMGDMADELKHRTQDIAAEGFEHAKEAARQVYEEASNTVREEGMTPEAARRAARAAVDAARDTVEDTVDSVSGRQPKSKSGRGPRNPMNPTSGE